MKYEVTFSCGHTDTVELYGPTKDREWRINEYESHGLCPDCYQKDRAEKLEKEKVKDDLILASYNAPDLTGSEKQISWASKIRLVFLKRYQEFMEMIEFNKLLRFGDKLKNFLKQVDDVSEIFPEILKIETESRFWIDNRNTSLYRMVDSYEVKTAEEFAQEKDEVMAEAVMVPENQSHPGVVEIRVSVGGVKAIYQKDTDFKKIVVKYRFRWNWDNHCYERQCTDFTGSAVERAAELANALLLEGFSVTCLDADVCRRAQAADFNPECRRWVKFSPKNNVFFMRWDRDDKNFYELAKKLPGSRWDRDMQAMTVSGTSWRELLDFADINAFELSSKAKEAAGSFKAAEIPVVPEIPKEPSKEDKLQDILNSSKEVLPDLRDD